jgi:TRAP-type C4-dicarboxylate transport system permease small subunit
VRNKKIKRILNLIAHIEDSLVILFLFGILAIALIQIVLRNFFESGLIWGDSSLNILVLWLGLAGSIVATRENKHINIDILSQYLPENYKTHIKKIGLIFSSTVCLIISYYSFSFISSEYTLNEYVFLKIPAWFTESIIPISFFVMGIRYFLQSIYYKTGSTSK